MINYPLTRSTLSSISPYNQLQIILTSLTPVQTTASFFGLALTASITIMCNIISITMYDVLPPNLYMLGPFWSLVLFIGANIVLKNASQYGIVSKEMLRRWKKNVTLSKTGKEHARRVRAMRLIRPWIGIWRTNMIPVDRKLMCDYDVLISESTLDCLLVFEE